MIDDVKCKIIMINMIIFVKIMNDSFNLKVVKN